MRISDWSSDVCSSDLQRITGLGQDAHQGFLLKLFKSGHDGQTPNQFRYEAELDEIFGLDLGEQFAYAFFRFGAHRRREADPRFFGTVAYDLVEPVEGAPDDEQDIGGEIGRESCRARVWW